MTQARIAWGALALFLALAGCTPQTEHCKCESGREYGSHWALSIGRCADFCAKGSPG